MSENFDASRNASEEANNKTMGEEEQAINEQQELRGRIDQAETSYRKKKELYDQILEHGLTFEELMKDITAENTKLSGRVKQLQQQLANIKKKWEEEKEAQRQELLFKEEEKRIVRNQSIYIRKMKKEIQKLREQNENLTVELDQLSLREKYQDRLEKLRTTEQELENKLEGIREALDSKDDEIKRKSLTLVQTCNEIEENSNNIEALRQEQRELKEQLRSAQEEQILAAQSSLEEPISEKRQPLNTSATDEEDEEHRDGRTGSWWDHCAMSLWEGVKVTGFMTLSVGLMASVAPVCNSPDPDCDLWSIAFDVLEPYSQLQHTHPTVN